LSAKRDTTGCAATQRRTPAGVPDSLRFPAPLPGCDQVRIYPVVERFALNHRLPSV